MNNIPKLMKDSGHRFMKLYEPQQDKSRPKKPIPGYITVKLQNVKDKENILKAAGGKRDLLYLNKQ